MKVINQYKLGNKKPAAAPKAVVEPKPRASKKRAAAISPKKEEVKIETTPEVVSPLLVEEPVVAEVSDDIKEILANSEE